MKNNHKYSFVVILLFILAGCNLFNGVPNGFPDKDEFAQMLSDIHFTEAVVGQVRSKDRNANDKANRYYSDILQKYDLTQEKFDTVVAWYTSQPELYKEVYENVVRILSEREAKWQNEVEEVKEELDRMKKLREERNIWIGDKKQINVSKEDSINRKVAFDMEVDTIHNQGFQVSAFYQFLKGNEIKKASLDLITLYADSSLDTIHYNIPISFTSKKVELDIDLKDTLNILRIKGFLLNHDTSLVANVHITDIEFIYLAPEDSIVKEVE